MLSRQVYTTADLIDFHLPLRDFYARCLRAGKNPVWCPNLFCGFYVHGEGQVGMAHPIHLLLYGLLPLDLAFNAEWLLNYPFAFAGMTWFLHRRGLGSGSAAFGGLLFAFCGFNVLRYLHLNYLAPFVHAPWLLATSDILLSAAPRPARWAFGGLALFTASAFLLGQPQIVYLVGMVELAYLAWRLGAGRRTSWRRVPWWDRGESPGCPDRRRAVAPDPRREVAFRQGRGLRCLLSDLLRPPGERGPVRGPLFLQVSISR
jgi:hypothetical protein